MLQINLFFENPAFLGADYADPQLAYVTKLGAPGSIIWEYMGEEINDIVELFDPSVKNDVTNLLKRTKNNLDAMIKKVRHEFHEAKGVVEEKEKMKKLEALKPFTKEDYEALKDSPREARVIATLNQLRDVGFLGIQVSWQEFMTTILNRFAGKELKIEGNIRVFPADVDLSSKDLCIKE